MRIEELYDFMVKYKVLKAKCGDIELELSPDALIPKMTKEEQEQWEKAAKELNKEAEKYNKIDPRFWSV